MPETDTGPLTTSKMELAVTILNGSPYMLSLSNWPGDSRIYHLSPTLLLSCKISSISNKPLLLNQARFAPIIP